MDQIFIQDLIVRGVIGVDDFEREQPQDIVINIVVFTDTQKGAVTDAIEDCVNYRTLAKMVQSHVETAARYTVEALADDIVQICFQMPGVIKTRVRVEKPGAVRFSRSVGVEIERQRPE
ncbi:MAG: dihydroneopterin aldolase [Anaerolineaceae bacterium]|nr:dihydroneopterin aldolase [Anaerolineaceae bacterium]